MNPELLLSFAIMQGLAPAGTTVPVEAVFTSADAMPAWARFTFQVHLTQRLQEDLATSKRALTELRTHHDESHERTAALKSEMKVLFRAIHETFESKPKYAALVAELRTRPDLAHLVELYDSRDA